MAAEYIPEGALRWILFASLLGMAIWVLIPDKLDDEDAPKPRYGPFLTTTIAFFIAEMGDKTQIATVLLAAKYDQLVMVVIGTTVGMLLANVPVVALGAKFAHRLPLKAVTRPQLSLPCWRCWWWSSTARWSALVRAVM